MDQSYQIISMGSYCSYDKVITISILIHLMILHSSISNYIIIIIYQYTIFSCHNCMDHLLFSYSKSWISHFQVHIFLLLFLSYLCFSYYVLKGSWIKYFARVTLLVSLISRIYIKSRIYSKSVNPISIHQLNCYCTLTKHIQYHNIQNYCSNTYIVIEYILGYILMFHLF